MITPDATPAPAPAPSAAKPAGVPTPLILALLVALLLVPFINKAYHIDDPLFVWSARHIQAHPLEPYGFFVNWYSRDDPMYTVTQNPPLACYYIAAVARVAGWSVQAMHIAFLLPAIGAVLGAYQLARRLCRQPVIAALATLATPVFLISATTVMCDVLMLCFWVWALVAWLAALDERRAWWQTGLLALGAALLIVLAEMTKYFGVSLVPLLLAYALLRRRFWPALFLVLPIAGLVAFHLATQRIYGYGLLREPASYVSFTRTHDTRPWPLTLLNLLAFTGGCLLPALLLFPFLVGRALRWMALGCFALTLLAVANWGGGHVMGLTDADGNLNFLLAIELAVFAAGGVGVLVLAVLDMARHRSADAWLLGLWVIGTFLFTGCLNWTVNGRSILPMAPAVGILLARRIESCWKAHAGPEVAAPRWLGVPAFAWGWIVPVGLSAVVGLSGAWADQSVANVNRTAAAAIVANYGEGPGTLWFEGHWGFQYYAQLGGARPLAYGNVDLGPGDFVALPLNNSGIEPLPGSSAKLAEEFFPKVTPWISVHNGFTGAGFYSDIWGSAPFVLGPSKREQFLVLQMTGTVRGSLISAPSGKPVPPP